MGMYMHRQADPDALGAAIAVAEISKQAFGKSVRIMSDGINKVSASVAKQLGVTELLSDRAWNLPHTAVILDANSFHQLGRLATSAKSQPAICIVDHHATNENTIVDVPQIILPNTTSACEIIWKLAKDEGLSLNELSKRALITGMISDTRRFINVIPETFNMAIDLDPDLKLYPDCNGSLQHETGHSERIARLKAAARVRIGLKGDMVVAVSGVSSYEASAARFFVNGAANLAVVMAVDGKGQNARGSIRADRSMINDHGFSASLLAESIVKRMGGTSGGHTAAAGMNFERLSSGNWQLKTVIQTICTILSEEWGIEFKRL